uniref:Uncharacterized protein n=1 Tax=Arundo donax TaxID=35708 RepID=A0A0A9ATS4_ARUDO
MTMLNCGAQVCVPYGHRHCDVSLSCSVLWHICKPKTREGCFFPSFLRVLVFG